MNHWHPRPFEPITIEGINIRNRLPATLWMLDKIGTSLYADAVIPVALAHAYASIPLKTGSRVLTLLSRQFLGAQAE